MEPESEQERLTKDGLIPPVTFAELLSVVYVTPNSQLNHSLVKAFDDNFFAYTRFCPCQR